MHELINKTVKKKKSNCLKFSIRTKRHKHHFLAFKIHKKPTELRNKLS